jgi:hypothetical protein
MPKPKSNTKQTAGEKKSDAKQASGDKKQIGLTDDGAIALKELMDAEVFASETDAYRLGIGYALARGLDPHDAPERGYTTKFNAAGGIDPYGQVKSLITILRPQDDGRPYATAERLAEVGISEIASRLRSRETIANILDEFSIAWLEDDEVITEEVGGDEKFPEVAGGSGAP